MEAGRELDALIAFKVMSYETYKGGWCDCANDRPLAPLCGYVADRMKGAESHKWVIPYFSSDMAAAWEIVEHLEKHELQFAFSALSSGGKNTVVFCGNGDVSATQYSESMPLGICLAALIVVGYVEEPPKKVEDYGALKL